MVLCFGFVTKTVSIMHETSVMAEQHLHNIKAFSVSHTALPMSSLRMWKKLGEDRAMTADPSDQRDVPYIWHHAQHKNSGTRRECGDSDLLSLSIQVTIRVIKPCFPGSIKMPAC